MKKKEKKNRITRICNLLFSLIVVVIIIVGGGILLPQVIGYNSYCVLGTSMEDKIMLGSLIYMKKVPKEELKEGNTIVFETSEKKGEGIIRNIVEVDLEKESYVTKAESSDYADASEVAYENILGKVVKVLPYGGFIVLFFQTKLGLIAAVAIFLLLIVLQLLGDIFEEKKKLPKLSKKA